MLVGLILALSMSVMQAAPPSERGAVPPPTQRELSYALAPLEARMLTRGRALLGQTDDAALLDALDHQLWDLQTPTELLTTLRSPALSRHLIEFCAQESYIQSTLDKLCRITGPQHRSALSRALEVVAWSSQTLLATPHVLEQLREGDPGATVAQAFRALGDKRRPERERHALLAYQRGQLALSVLLTAATDDTLLSPHISARAVTLLAEGQEHFLAHVTERPPPIAPSTPWTPRAELLLAYACEDVELLAASLDRHPPLASLILELRQHLHQHFGETHIEHVVLRPSLDEQALPGDQLVIEVHTPLAPKHALSALDCFDERWWLDAAPRCPVEIIVDTRLV